MDGKSTVWLKILFKAVLLMPCSCLTLKHACSPPVSYDDSNTCLFDIGIIHVNHHFLISVINMMIRHVLFQRIQCAPLLWAFNMGNFSVTEICDKY